MFYNDIIVMVMYCFIKNNVNYKDLFGFENCVLNKK